MNIFVTNDCPFKSAIALDDKRVVKMVLESTQMLCTAINEYGGKTPYKSTHKNHPCNVWVRQNRANFAWLFKHAIALSNEYKHRYGRQHKCTNILVSIIEKNLFDLLPNTEYRLYSFVNCAAHKGKGLDFKSIQPTVEAYKQYLNSRWSTDVREPKWTNREPPKWFTSVKTLVDSGADK